MGHRSFALQHTKRLVEKYRDLRATTGSRRRACLFIGKYILQKARYLVLHYALAARRRRIRLQVLGRRIQPDAIQSPIVAIKVTGGVGDLVVIARYIRDLLSASERFDFHVFYKDPEIAEWVFRGTSEFKAAYSEFLFDHTKSHYALSLWISQFIVFYSEVADWAMLREKRTLMKVLQNISRTRRYIEPAIAAHPYMDGYLSQKAVYMNFRRADFLHGLSGIPYGGDTYDLHTSATTLKRYDLQPQQYVTIHNGFDPSFVISAERATKCYPYFAEVLRIIKRTCPDLKFVQVGVSTSVAIAGVDLNIIGQCSLQDTAELLKHAKLHVDNESGLVHIAKCLGLRSCVVFGPTPADYFGYEGNLNLKPPVCGGCWWINQTWMDQCPRGFKLPACMESHLPSAVAAAIIGAINGSEQTASDQPM